MAIKLSELFPRLRDLGTVRLVSNNGTAVLEFNTVIEDVSLGPRSWNFHREGQEFHLYKDKVKAVTFFYGEHPRFKRKLGEIDFLDEAGNVGMMLFLAENADDPTNPAVQAMQRLVADYGERAEVEEESAPASTGASH
jgi:putative heme degradation protein